MPDATIVRILVRIEDETNEPIALFVDDIATDTGMHTCFDLNNGHSSYSDAFVYERTKRATKADTRKIVRTLINEYGYNIQVITLKEFKQTRKG